MERTIRIPIVMLTTGLVVVGIAAGILQFDQSEFTLGTIVLLEAAALVSVLLTTYSIFMLLSAVIPTPAYRPLSKPECRLGGIILGVVLVIGVVIVTYWFGYAGRNALFVPLILAAVVAPVASWFMKFCLMHLCTQDRPVPFKVLWLVLLFFGSLVVMPMYWCIFVWRPHIALPSRSENSARHA